MPTRQPRTVRRDPRLALADAPVKRFCIRVDFRMNLRLMGAVFVALARRHPAVMTVELHHTQPADRMRTYLEAYGSDDLHDIVDAWTQVPDPVRQWAQRQVQAYLEHLRRIRPVVYARLMASETVRVPR